MKQNFNNHKTKKSSWKHFKWSGNSSSLQCYSTHFTKLDFSLFV